MKEVTVASDEHHIVTDRRRSDPYVVFRKRPPFLLESLLDRTEFPGYIQVAGDDGAAGGEPLDLGRIFDWPC